MSKNAIERRLDRLYNQWNDFAVLPEARVLRWLIRDDELRMVETFLAMEADHRAGELPDLFVVFSEPFADVDAYGEALLGGFLAQYESTRPSLEEAGLDSSWTVPPIDSRTHSLLRLVAACTSCRAHHDATVERLVLVLMPTRVADHDGWQRWIRACGERLPSDVRLLMVDDVEAPTLGVPGQDDPAWMHSVSAALDMPGAMTELAQAGGTDTPGGRFRVHFTALTTALGDSDLDRAGVAADSALTIARESGWPHLAAVVHLTMGSALITAGRVEDAIGRYGEAAAAGQTMVDAGDTTGAKLRMNAAFGMGAALLSVPDFPRAAHVYESTVPLAQQAGDALMLLECWRMAAYCHEQAGETGKAWEHGFRALDAAEGMPPGDRANSTLPFVRDALLRLAGGSQPHIDAIEHRVAEVIDAPGPPTAGVGGP